VEPIRSLQKRYCSRAMTFAIVLALGLILAGFKPQAKGLVLGTLFSIVNFILLGQTLPWRIGKPKRQAVIAALGSRAIRLVLMALPMAAALHWTQFDLIAVVAGLFMVQATILADPVLARVWQGVKTPG